YCIGLLSFFFFFQAEDGIRDFHVTGVQTCALPICNRGIAQGMGAHDVVTTQFIHPVAGALQEAQPAKASRHEYQHECDQHCGEEIGRASCREREEVSVVAAALKKEEKKNVSATSGR